jgi:uncharacterized protein involved in exopolysaccharide biosynthesis
VTKAEIKETLKDEQTQEATLAELKSDVKQLKEQITVQSVQLADLQREIDAHGVTSTSQHKTIRILRDQLTTNVRNQRRLKKHVSQTKNFTQNKNKM